MNKMKNKELSNWNFVLLLLTITFLVATLILLGVRYYESKQLTDDFVIPKQYNGVWLSLEQPKAVVVFDLTDPEQAQVAKQVDSFFKQRNIQQP